MARLLDNNIWLSIFIFFLYLLDFIVDSIFSLFVLEFIWILWPFRVIWVGNFANDRKLFGFRGFICVCNRNSLSWSGVLRNIVWLRCIFYFRLQRFSSFIGVVFSSLISNSSFSLFILILSSVVGFCLMPMLGDIVGVFAENCFIGICAFFLIFLFTLFGLSNRITNRRSHICFCAEVLEFRLKLAFHSV